MTQFSPAKFVLGLAVAATALILTTCSKDDSSTNPPPDGGTQMATIDFSAATPSVTCSTASGPTSRKITGGTLPLTITDQPEGSVATAVLRTDTLVITPTGAGSTSVTITDSSPRPGEAVTRTLTISITVSAGSGGLTAYPAQVFVEVGHTAPTGISGGTTPYAIQTQPLSSIATASLNGTVVAVTGVTLGTTSLVVRDASQPPLTVTVPITINTGGGQIQITVGSGTTPTYSWAGGPINQLHVLNTTDGSFAWWVVCGSNCISSPVTHGTVPAGAMQMFSNELVLTPGVEYQVVVARTNGEVGNQLFTP